MGGWLHTGSETQRETRNAQRVPTHTSKESRFDQPFRF